MNDLDSLRLELEAEKHNHYKDNLYFVGEVERLRAGLQEIADHCGTDYYLGDVGDWAREILAAESPASDPRPDPRTHPEHWTE